MQIFNSIFAALKTNYTNTMGKGDLRSKRGKIVNGSYGKTRPSKDTKPVQQDKKRTKKYIAKVCAAHV